jgi:hypothetical protein
MPLGAISGRRKAKRQKAKVKKDDMMPIIWRKAPLTTDDLWHFSFAPALRMTGEGDSGCARETEENRNGDQSRLIGNSCLSQMQR